MAIIIIVLIFIRAWAPTDKRHCLETYFDLKEILLEILFIEVIKLLEVIKRCLKPCSTASFICEIILESYLLLMSRNFETQGCHWYKIKRIKFILADSGNSGKRFGASLFYLK